MVSRQALLPRVLREEVIPNAPIVLCDLKIMLSDAFSQIGYSSPSEAGIMTDLDLTVSEVNENYRCLLSFICDMICSLFLLCNWCLILYYVKWYDSFHLDESWSFIKKANGMISAIKVNSMSKRLNYMF